MNMRKITSLTALLSFVLLMVTSIILYVMPSGRVAYWSNWKFLLLSKEQWGALHLNLGCLLLFSIVLHIYYNWGLILNYLRNRTKKLRVFTPNFTIALALTLAVFLGTIKEIPPMSTIVNLGTSITDDANLFYGEPPYGHAELSPLSDFAAKVKIDLQSSLANLAAAGIMVESASQTMQEIGKANGVSPQLLYTMMKSTGNNAESTGGMPAEAPGGTGNRTLEKLCALYKLDLDAVTTSLAAQGINAKAEQTIKEIAVENSLDPQAVYAEIYKIHK